MENPTDVWEGLPKALPKTCGWDLEQGYFILDMRLRVSRPYLQ